MPKPTLLAAGGFKQIVKEVKSYKIDIVVLQEMKQLLTDIVKIVEHDIIKKQ